MVKIEKIRADLFTNLYESFLKDDDPLSSEQDWRNVFDYRWPTEQEHCGYALLDEGRVVGMIGMVFSERLIEGVQRNFCNLHTWWVREDHRGRSLALIRPVLKLKDHTITHFTADAEVRAITKRLGFTELSSQLKVLLPIGRDRRLPGTVELTDDDQQMEPLLSEPEKKILADHRPYGVGHLLLSDGKGRCYILYTHVLRHRLPYCHIHYIGDKQVFARNERAIRAWLVSKHHVKFVAMDRRLIDDLRFARSFNFWAPSHAVYRPVGVSPDQVDHLYSDVVFLKLTTMPDMSHEIGRLIGRLSPFSQRAS